MFIFNRYKTIAPLVCTLAMTTSCGDGSYTKNADKTVQGSADAKENDDAADKNKKNPAGNNDPDSGESSTGTNTNGSDTASSTNLETLLDQLAGVFGNGGASGNTSTPNEPETNTPTPIAPEPTSDDCIGADEFICAIEVAITFHTNKIRPANNPLLHHARLSFVSRDWSDRQAASGSISHRGFPDDRRRVYTEAFPGDSVGIQGENVAFSSSNSTSADEVARMFVDMWAKSPGHRRNMLGNFEILGVGVTKKGNRFYATQIFGQE
jgi:uncharacterized protein YkwD